MLILNTSPLMKPGKISIPELGLYRVCRMAALDSRAAPSPIIAKRGKIGFISDASLNSVSN